MSNIGDLITTDLWSFTTRTDIVEHFSIGLYRDFPRAIKELISNSYDADAENVTLDFDLTNRKIIISDDGKGMGEDELRSLIDIGKRSDPSELLQSGRHRIGTFGIGILSVFPYVEKMTVVTKKQGSDKIYQMIIDTTQFFEGDKFVYVPDAKVEVSIFKSRAPIEKGETSITLDGVVEHIISDFQEASSSPVSIEREDSLLKVNWYLAQYSPICFPDSFELKDFFSYPERTPMKLWIMGEEVFRNVPRNNNMVILENAEINIEGVDIKYCIATPYKPVVPNELRGFQLRFNDVGIGLPRNFDIQKTGKVLGKFNYLWGEIHILNGLDSSLMITRDEFFYTEAYSEIVKYFQKILSKWNARIEKSAKQDKTLYRLIDKFSGSDKIENEFKDNKLILLPKDRMRLSSGSISKPQSDEVDSIVNILEKTLKRNTDFSVIQSEEKSEKPIKIDSERQEIVIFSSHTDYEEQIEFDDTNYAVTYEEWDIAETPSLCRFEDKKVIYNKKHPIFDSKLNNEIIKKMCIGFNSIIENVPNKAQIVTQFENLLIQLF